MQFDSEQASPRGQNTSLKSPSDLNIVMNRHWGFCKLLLTLYQLWIHLLNGGNIAYSSRSKIPRDTVRHNRALDRISDKFMAIRASAIDTDRKIRNRSLT